MTSTKFSSLAVLSSLFLLSLFTVSVTSHQENQLLHAEKNETTQQHPQQHKNDTKDGAGDLNEDGYDFDEDDKKEIKAIRRAVRALAHKMMMQNNLPMPMSNNNMPMMTDDQQMQMMQNSPQDMNNMDTTMMVEGSGDSMMGADGDLTTMEGMQQQGQVMQTNPQMMTSQQMMQQPPPYQVNTMSHPNVQMMHTQPQQQQQHHMMMGSQQMMNPNHPTNMMMNNGQQQQNMGSHQMPMMMNHQNPMLGVRHVPSPSTTPQDVQLTTVNATNNATASNMSTIVQFNPLPGSRLTRSLYAIPNANQQQSHVTPNQTSFNSQVPNNSSTNSTSSEFQQGLNTTLLQQNGTSSQNSSQVSEDQRPVHPKLQGVAHMFRNIF